MDGREVLPTQYITCNNNFVSSVSASTRPYRPPLGLIVVPPVNTAELHVFRWRHYSPSSMRDHPFVYHDRNMRVFIVTYLCSVVGVYTCAVDAEQCIRALKRVGCVGATVCETRLNAQTTTGESLLANGGTSEI